MIDLSHSYARRQFEFLSGSDADARIFVRQVSISFGESVAPETVRRAWDVVVAAIPVLAHCVSHRTDESGESAPSAIWRELDWSSLESEQLGAEWASLLERDAAEAFENEITRVTLVRLPGDGIHLLWSSDAGHLDYSSVAGTLVRWFAATDLIASGQPVEWPSDPDPAPAVAKIADRPRAAEEEFWRNYFEGYETPREPVVLPMGDPESAQRRAAVTHTYERADRLDMMHCAESIGVALPDVARAAWAFVLSQVVGAPDLLLAQAQDVDADSPLAETAGRFETWLPRRVKFSPDATCRDAVLAMPTEFAGQEKFSTADEIARTTSRSVDGLRAQGAFVFRDGTLNDTLRRALPRWMAADISIYEKVPHPLTLVWTDADRPEITLGYDPTRFSEQAARSLLSRWVRLVAQILAEPETKLRDISLLLPGETADVRGVERRTGARSLVPQCVHEALADVAAERADATALELGVETIPFSRLTSQSNQLARFLQKNGVESGDAVGFAISRSPVWPVGLLGIWKAGATVVLLPQDSAATTPPKALKAVLVDANTASSVTTEDGVKRIPLDTGWSAVTGEKTRAMNVAIDPSAAAVRALDSDGTWRDTSHEQVLASALALVEVLEISPADRVLQFSSTDLPASIEEFLATALAGAVLVLRPEDALATRTAFHEFVGDSKVSVSILPTAFWGQWLHYCTEVAASVPESLRAVVTFGWHVLPPQRQAWQAIAPTVESIHITPVGGWLGSGYFSDARPLGRQMAPMASRVVGVWGRPLPPGFGGDVEAAFSPDAGDKSKDRVSLRRWCFRSLDGEFIDRDFAAGERGVFDPRARILAMEWAAAAHPAVCMAVADIREIDGKPQRCVWIVPNDTLRGEPLDFRNSLNDALPAEFVPERVGCLQRLPLTRAGTVDFGALPEPTPDAPQSSSRHERGSDDEELVRSVIGKVLGGRIVRLDETIREGRNRPPVAKSMRDALVQSGFNAELSDLSVPFTVRSLVRAIRSRRPASESGWVPLKPLRISGNLPPLVLIHDFSGSSRSCESLAAALGEDQPCYAITARGLVEPAVKHTSVEDMAREYVAALKAMDPDGPHGLVGVGFGGMIAFECARQLHAQGCTPRFVAILRAEPPTSSAAVRGIKLLSRNLLKSLRGNAAKPSPSSSGSSSSVAEANRDAAARYAPEGVAPFEIHAFVPEHEFPTFREIQSGWNAICSGVNYYQVPCSASELVEEPAVSAVAEAILKLVRSEEIEVEEPEEDEEG